MIYQPPYKKFIFKDFHFDSSTGLLALHYSFDNKLNFYERVYFDVPNSFDQEMFNRVAFLAFVVAGISYYKCYPTKELAFERHGISSEQADFFNTIYKHGLSQFVYENGLSPDDIGTFEVDDDVKTTSVNYGSSGTVVLQSGGKDSLLLATLLEQKGIESIPWYLSQAATHPLILDSVHGLLKVPKREVDRQALELVQAKGAFNGHVPVTFITLSYALIDAVLHGKDTVLAAIGREGEEPHAYIGNYPVQHQWSKTWEAEQLFANYVHNFISPTFKVGSPLRAFSELKIAELFVKYAWDKFGHQFSSCNVANYKQGHDNEQLSWCSHCPKCANSFLLLAPFVKEVELSTIFGGNLFKRSELINTFKGLLAVDDIMKPFECVGETEELQQAYWLARDNGYPALPFEVLKSDFDKDALGPHQTWATQMLQ